jgi:hypothetical protein
MSLDGGITPLASWGGNTIMPTLSGLFFAGAVYRYSKGGAYGQFLYGGFGALMCSGILRTLEGFVTHAGPTNADAYYLALVALVSYVGNVILPVFALTQFGAMALHMGGVMAEIYPGSTWLRHMIAGFGALMISGFGILMNFASHFVGDHAKVMGSPAEHLHGVRRAVPDHPVPDVVQVREATRLSAGSCHVADRAAGMVRAGAGLPDHEAVSVQRRPGRRR